MTVTTINHVTIYKRLFSLVPAEGLVVRAIDHDPEEGSYPYKRTHDKKSVVREIVQFYRKLYRRSIEGPLERLSEIQTLSDIKDALSDLYEDGGVRVIFVGSPAEAEAQKVQEERRRLERTASQMAQAHGVRIDSFEFIALLESQIEAQKDYREGLREDGLCIGYGVTPEQWFDEYNYSQSETSSVHDILDFLTTYCPLLMAQYKEQKLQEVSIES